MTVSRRTILVALPLGTVAGCRSHPPARPDPDAAALAAARDTEARLVASYDASDPRRAAHLAHLTALGGRLPSTPPAPEADPASLARSSVSVLQAAAIAASAGRVAAVFASVAAAHLAAP